MGLRCGSSLLGWRPQPAGPGLGEAFGEIAEGIDTQFAAQALGGNDLSDHQQLGLLLHQPKGHTSASIMIGRLGLPMADSLPILPGSTVVVRDGRSIYNGYQGFVQRISGSNAAVLFEGGNWDKLVTMPLKILEQA